MSEAGLVAATRMPHTRATLAHDLRQLGLSPGMTVLVHSSLRSLGWVCGGAVTVVQALMDVLTPQGTLVMPTHTSGNSDPARWENPPVPEAWWPVIRESMPGFDPRVTPSAFMGAIPEVFRAFPGVKRSHHPLVSFAAWGREADGMTERHALAYSLGEGSPLARLYDGDAQVLLLGVGHDSNTSFHLAEYRTSARPTRMQGAAVIQAGGRHWVTYSDLDVDSEAFARIGAAFEQVCPVRIGLVGQAECRWFSQRHAVDFACDWFNKNPACSTEQAGDA